MVEILSRSWDELIARDSGPMHVRILLQPLVASLVAARTGLSDARKGRPLFFWTMALERLQRRALLQELWRDVGTIFLIACILDVIYQLLVLRWVYPGQTLIMATVLAILPYLLIRGLANRVGRWFGSSRGKNVGEG